jgi:nitronate monooxygenase
MLGADFGYMGTRFISATESMVSDDYRQMLIRAGMIDIVTTAAITGVKGNWLRESLERSGFDFGRVDIAAKIDFSDIQSDNKAWKNVWGAGHGVANITAIQTTAEIVEQLAENWAALTAASGPAWTDMVSSPSLSSIAPVS